MKCTFDEDINECPFYDKKTKLCSNNNKCSFQESSSSSNQEKYVRKERWYEKYYKK